MNEVVVGIISDTHGLLRPEAINALSGCNLIIHAGDIGQAGILHELQEIAPVHAVRGNIDTEPWASSLPETEVVDVAETSIYVLHDRNRPDLKPAAAGFAVVISGHSHQPARETIDGVLYFNPGSAGPKRFCLPVSLGQLLVHGKEIRSKHITLDV
jgi:hypothetical protein